MRLLWQPKTSYAGYLGEVTPPSSSIGQERRDIDGERASSIGML